ncbi:MAG: hypothetical protein WA172_12640 [Terriglobales bacterium]
MDYESRELYRREIVNIAYHSDCDEMQVAMQSLALARQAQQLLNDDPRVTLRASHVGSYLLAEGRDLLEEKVGFNPPFGQRFPTWLRKHPDDFYLPGIAALTSHQGVVQRWFHSHPRVQATELLLQEKPVDHNASHLAAVKAACAKHPGPLNTK